jgi:ABC-2 type transport system permease protein
MVLLQQELRDLWIGGRGLLLSVAFSLLLSIVSYLVATNRALNFLEQRETVNLTLQVAIAVGALLTLLAAADAISGERERGTLESLLVTPASRLDIVLAKAVAALSLWLASFAITLPYVWFLGRGIGIVRDAAVTGLVVGFLLAVFLAGFGVVISVLAASYRWAGELLLRVNPMTAGEHYVGRVVVNGRAWSDDVSWLLSPLVGAVVLTLAVVVLAPRFVRLGGAGS